MSDPEKKPVAPGGVVTGPGVDPPQHPMDRVDEQLTRILLVLFGLFVVETISSLCLLFIIIYSLYMNAQQ